jgi:hypothetical protein
MRAGRRLRAAAREGDIIPDVICDAARIDRASEIARVDEIFIGVRKDNPSHVFGG